MGFETLKNRFFHNFLYNSITYQEYFPKVSSQYRSKIIGERDFRNPLSFGSFLSLYLIHMGRRLF